MKKIYNKTYNVYRNADQYPPHSRPPSSFHFGQQFACLTHLLHVNNNKYTYLSNGH